MITNTMSALEIQAEVNQDHPRVVYALKKSYGGRLRYEAELNQMCQSVLREPDGTILMGNIETYHSHHTGNHWMAYAFAENVGFHAARSGMRCFAYWDDDGSIAALQISGKTQSSVTSSFIYSGHFFQRYAERENLGPVDLQLVCDFMRRSHNGVFQADDDPQAPGRHRFDLITDQGIGRGYTTELDINDPGKPFVAHVRTYLPSHMLTPNQRQQTAEARNQQALKSRPADAFVTMMLGEQVDEMPDFFADLFITRGGTDAMGRAFVRLMGNIVMFELKMRNTPLEEYRGVMLQVFHQYQQSVFDIVTENFSSSYSLEEIAFVMLLTNPALDVRALVATMLELPPDHHSVIRQADRIQRSIDRANKKFKQSARRRDR